jgi:hypothetical protein
MSVFQLDPKRRIRQRFQYLALHLYGFFLCHPILDALYLAGNPPPPLKLVFFNRLSYW